MSNQSASCEFGDFFHARNLSRTDVSSSEIQMALPEAYGQDEGLPNWIDVRFERARQIAGTISAQSELNRIFSPQDFLTSDHFDFLPSFIGRYWETNQEALTHSSFGTNLGDVALVLVQKGATTRSVDVGRPGLLTQQADERLAQMARLQPGWDGYDAKRVSKTATKLTRLCLARLPSAMGNPAVAPVADGSVSIVWEKQDAYLEIEIDKEGEFSYYGESASLGEHELHDLDLTKMIEHPFFDPYRQAIIAAQNG